MLNIHHHLQNRIPMITIPLIEACIAIGGRSNTIIPALSQLIAVQQNSKEVVKGTLFVALRGNRVDGHDYIKEAEESGAIAAVVEQEMEGITIPQLIVPCTKEALGSLAKIWKGRLDIPLIAVTGSVGKTTTKELIAHVLEEKLNIHKSRKNFNNELGVPIELMKLHTAHECSIVEFGMRDHNQINYLSKIARPTISVITNIGMSHIENLGSRHQIAKAKAEIFEGMDAGGIALLNRDDEFYSDLVAASKGKVITFGVHKKSNIQISNIQLTPKGHPTFDLNGVAITMNNCVGKHHAQNAAIAFAIGLEFGMKTSEIANRLATFKAPERRGVMSFSFNKARLLDNTYNAAPDSLKASLFTISHMHNLGNRTLAVIGEMLELGEYSQEAHQHIGEIITEIGGIDILVTIGVYSKYIGTASTIKNRKHFESAAQAALFLLDEIKEDDIVLLQGSNSLRLDHIVDVLERGDLPDNAHLKITKTA